MAPMTEAELSPQDGVTALVHGAPVTVDEKMTLRSIAAVLAADDIGAALVHRDHETIGIISERDVVRALADDADPDTVWSSDVMTERLVTAEGHESILQVGMRMLDEGIRHVAVREHGSVVGVVSSRDVFQVLCEDTLEAL